MQESLLGKRILFIATSYFDYYQFIAKAMRKQGAEVDVFEDSIVKKTGLAPFLRGKLRLLIPKLNKQYFRKIVRSCRTKYYDIVIVIRGECLDEYGIQRLRTYLPKAKFVLYQWDSLINYNYLHLTNYFDKVSSFDPQDCKEHGFVYWPLFGLDEMHDGRFQTSRSIDFLYLGYNHSQRYQIGKIISANKNYKSVIKLFSPPISFLIKNGFKAFLQKKIDKNFMPEISMKSTGTEEWIQLLHQSKFVLDIQHPGQKGLTMRTLESLISGCHLITTNPQIYHEPFYDPEVVSVVSINNFSLPEGLKYIQKKIPALEPYVLSSWVTKLVS